jgi:HTH-type transcriptional regulator/antitoxin HigA
MAVKIGGEARPKVRKATAAKPAKRPGPAKAHPPNRLKARQRFLASYYPLVRKFPLEPIRDDAHLSQALAVAEELLKRDLDEGADSYLNVLTGLIEAYESKAFPIPDASEGDVLRELMRLHGLSQPALEAEVGIAQPTISAVLRGTRGLTKHQVVALARFFHVSPEAFLRAK